MRRSSGYFVQRHPSGAKVILCEASAGADVALAVATMVGALGAPLREHLETTLVGGSSVEATVGHAHRSPVRLAKTQGLCSCGDCLGCDVQEMRRQHGAR